MNTQTATAQQLRDAAPDVAVGIDTAVHDVSVTTTDPDLIEVLAWAMSAPTASQRAVRVLATAKMLDRAAAL